MDTPVQQVMRDCTRASDEDSLSFPEVVARLAAAGVERYHADLCRAEKIYYLPDGGSLAVAAAPPAVAPAFEFSAAAVDAAVRAIQARTLTYKAFCDRIAAAGCVGYHVSIAGRRAVYYGRSGESHVEPFPAAR